MNVVGGRIQPVPAAKGRELDNSLTWRSRTAGLGIVVVLLGVSIFGVWSSHLTAAAADQVSVGIRIATYYSDAAKAVQREEAIELEYRINPTAEGRARHQANTTQLLAALTDIRRDVIEATGN